MDQLMLATVCRIIVGRHGRRMPAYGNVEASFTKGLFKDYYLYNSALSRKTYYKYLKETTQFPHFLIRHYGGENDYRRNLSDMMELVDCCPSISLLWKIQSEVFVWVTAYLPPEEAAEVTRKYINQNATRREIAEFLADVLHYAITKDNVANRPRETDGQV